MANIVFMMDLEEGHILPSFSLASSLKKAGHSILYIGLWDSEDLIRNAGFDFYPIFENHYPKGYKETYKELISKDHKKAFNQHLQDFFNNSFDIILENVKPDILLISSFFNIEMLILFYKYNIKPVILSPQLYSSELDLAKACVVDISKLPIEISINLLDILEKKNLRYSSFQQVVKPIDSFYHFILCSEALESKSLNYNKNTFYIGSGINQSPNTRKLAEFDSGETKIIYASMGSQSILYKEKIHLLFSKLTRIIQRPEMKMFHLVFAIGSDHAESDPIFNIGLSNVSVLKWANQIEILKNTSLAFIHGGLSSIKECILSNVPMVIIPGARDQPANALRVQHHKIGTVIQIETISDDDLVELIFGIVDNEEIKKRLLEMKTNFENLNSENIGLSIIQKILQSEKEQHSYH